MKKKILVALVLTLGIIAFAGCGKSSINIKDYVIEKRENLFTASDNIYCVTFSTGQREENYNFDGQINKLVPFGILTIARLDNQPMANDSYSFIVEINEQKYSGFLEKGANNSYSTDIEISALDGDSISASISFTGYTFNQQLENVSKDFEVDYNTAINIANNELKKSIAELLSDKNVKIEIVTKIMKDHSSSDLKTYYWYVGAISTNGNSFGILINTNTGEVIAKKC